MVRVRSAPASQTSQSHPKAPSARQALKEKTNTTRAKVITYDGDGNTEGLVKDAKPGLGRQRKVQENEDEFVMAGGLGVGSDNIAQLTSDVQTTTDELVKSNTVPSPRATRQRRPARTVKKVAASEAHNQVLQGLKQRMEATARGERSKPTATAVSSSDVPSQSSRLAAVLTSTSSKGNGIALEPSEVSRSPSQTTPEKLSVLKNSRASVIPPGSVYRMQHTPLVESSMMALKNFKRRPRQGSILQMVKQRTASARPSLSNATSIVVDAAAADDSDLCDLDFVVDDTEGDFAPDAEGTPLNAGKTKRKSIARADRISAANEKTVEGASAALTKKRKSDQMDVSHGSLSALHTKRQKRAHDVSSPKVIPAEEVFEGDEMVLGTSTSRAVVSARAESEDEEEIVLHSSPVPTETPRPALSSDVQVLNSQSTSTPPTDPPATQGSEPAKYDEFPVPSTEQDKDDGILHSENEEDVLDGTMADPLSSSPAAVHRQAFYLPDDFRPPATQVLPKPAIRTRAKKSKPMNTTKLQSLLPRRRQPLKPRGRKSEYDFERSDDDEDAELDVSHLEDEEDELGGRVHRDAKSIQAKSRKGPAPKRGRPSRVPTTQSMARPPAAAAKKALKTYGRPTDSDKENEGSDFEEAEESTLPEISMSMEDVIKSKELESAKAKFAAIDEWDLEFESMSAEDHRSSSQSWR